MGARARCEIFVVDTRSYSGANTDNLQTSPHDVRGRDPLLHPIGQRREQLACGGHRRIGVAGVGLRGHGSFGRRDRSRVQRTDHIAGGDVSAAGPGTVAQRMNSPVPVCGVGQPHLDADALALLALHAPVTNLYYHGSALAWLAMCGVIVVGMPSLAALGQAYGAVNVAATPMLVVLFAARHRRHRSVETWTWTGVYGTERTAERASRTACRSNKAHRVPQKQKACWRTLSPTCLRFWWAL
jgi:hypothetical protein